MGKGEGQGTGQGEGQGQASERNVAIGSGVIYVVLIIFCACGLPMLIAGSFLVGFNVYSESWLFYVGLSLIIVSSVLFVAGIIFGILLCCGVCGTKTPSNNSNQATEVTFTSPAPGEANYPMQQLPPQYSQVGSSGGQGLYPTQPQPVQYYNPAGAYPS